MGLEYAEGAVTLRPRRELKLVLTPAPARSFVLRLCAELGMAPLSTLITSVYFDGPELPLLGRALHCPDECLKVRMKEYFPDLGTPAEAEPRVVLEVKREHRGLTRKRRAWVAREQLRARSPGRVGVLPLIASGKLEPVLGVTYVREVYQQAESWRVTVDREISFYRVTPEVALSRERLSPERLGPPEARDARVVVEVKHLSQALPPWLARLSEHARRPYSKFTEGMTRLLSRRVDGAMEG